jgi:hypothetical protein
LQALFFNHANGWRARAEITEFCALPGKSGGGNADEESSLVEDFEAHLDASVEAA